MQDGPRRASRNYNATPTWVLYSCLVPFPALLLPTRSLSGDATFPRFIKKGNLTPEYRFEPFPEICGYLEVKAA